MRVQEFCAGNLLQSLKKKGVLTQKKINEQLCKNYIDINTEKSIMKDKAKCKYKKLLNPEMEVHSELESVGDDNEKGSKIQEVSNLKLSSDSIEEAEDDDASDSDFKSERDDISSSEKVDKKKMNMFFKEIWDSETQNFAKQIKEIKALGYEKEEAEENKSNQKDNKKKNIKIDTVEEEY